MSALPLPESQLLDPAVVPPALVTALAAVFGLLLGSFLNVCISRWGAEPKLSVRNPPRSRCPKCAYEIRWYDNVPVVSWLLLGARCRGCRAPISAQYPLVELATAVIWGYLAWRFGATLEALRGAVFATILLGITMTDFNSYIIPDEFSVGGLALGLLFALLGGLPELGQALLGAAVGFGLLWLVGAAGTWVFKQDAMGGGDVKMMAMVGAFLGWQGVLLTVFLGALLGTIVFLPLLLAGSKKLVPFGIFLGIGAFATYLVGPAILGWYAGYLQGV
ncbi:MAG TPA: prepilin peptidase [Gemmatimonadales bacterium]|nr:prepilin peptidase [Gemmatimonadales bacterium]